jgi:hypothetical protein
MRLEFKSHPKNQIIKQEILSPLIHLKLNFSSNKQESPLMNFPTLVRLEVVSEFPGVPYAQRFTSLYHETTNNRTLLSHLNYLAKGLKPRGRPQGRIHSQLPRFPLMGHTFIGTHVYRLSIPFPFRFQEKSSFQRDALSLFLACWLAQLVLPHTSCFLSKIRKPHELSTLPLGFTK